MLPFPSNPKPTGHPINTWLRQLLDVVKSQQPLNQDISSTLNGWYKNTTYDNKGIPMSWCGEYEDKKAYRKGEIVHVSCYKSYLSTNSNGDTVAVDSLPGIWICTYNTPMDLNLATDFEGMNDPNLLAFLRTLEKREAGVCYAPMYPIPQYEPAFLPENHKQGKFWQLIAFEPTEMITCVDGETQKYYVNMAISGSSYQL